MDGRIQQPGPMRTLSPQAALVYYHKLYQEQPLQFVQFYAISSPFRNAVHASGLCVVYPPDNSGPALARIPAAPPSHEVSRRDATNHVGGTVSVPLREQAPVSQFPQNAMERQHQLTLDEPHADGIRASQHTHFNAGGTDAAFTHSTDTRCSEVAASNLTRSVGMMQFDTSPSNEPLSPSVQQLFDSVAAAQRQGVEESRLEAIGHGSGAPQRRHLRHQRQEIGPHRSAGPEHQSHQGTPDVSQHNDRYLRSQARAGNGVQQQVPATEPLSASSAASAEVGQLTEQLNALFLRQVNTTGQNVDARSRGSAVMERRRAQGGLRATGNQHSTKHRTNAHGTTKPARVSRRTLEPIPKARQGSELSREQLNRVDRDAWDIFDQIRPEDGEDQRRARLLAHMNKVVRSEWPNACVRMFGSGANGLNMRNGDVDMCLMVPPQFTRQRRPDHDQGIRQSREKKPYREQNTPLTDKQIMRRMAGMLRRSKMTNVQELLRARVPIIKVSDPVSGFQIDLCLNNELVHHNTDLLRSYVSLDPRIRPLALLVKYWAKRRCINETYRGTLSSYAYVLLLINYLQVQGPPVLPCLQRMQNGRAVTENDTLPVQMVESPEGAVCNVYFDRSITRFDVGNKEALGKLFTGFFRYYAVEFVYSHSVVCPRLGRLVSRESKKWDEASVAELAARAEMEAEAEARADDDLAKFRRKQHLNSSAPPSVEFDEADFPSLDGKQNGGVSTTAVACHHRVGIWPESSKTGNKLKTAGMVSPRQELLGQIDTSGSDARIDDFLSMSKPDGDSTPSKPDDDIDVDVRRERYLKRKLRMIEQHHFCIEDPFELSHDIGRSVDAETLEVIRQEFVRAHDILQTTGDLHSVLSKWETP